MEVKEKKSKSLWFVIDMIWVLCEAAQICMIR